MADLAPKHVVYETCVDFVAPVIKEQDFAIQRSSTSPDEYRVRAVVLVDRFKDQRNVIVDNEVVIVDMDDVVAGGLRNEFVALGACRLLSSVDRDKDLDLTTSSLRAQACL